VAHALRITETFKARLRSKSSQEMARVLRAMNLLASNPRHPELRTKKVQNTQGIFEARVDRGLRMTFEWEASTIVLRNNCKHDDVLGAP